MAAILGVAGTWIAIRVAKLVGAKRDSEIRYYLESTILTGKDLAKKRVKERIDSGVSLNVKSEVVAEAARYVRDRVPDALKHFNISSESVADMVEARLGMNIEKEVNAADK